MAEEENKRIYEDTGAYENFYLGTATPLDADFGEYFTGYRMPPSQLGAPTSPQTANQISEATKLLNTGMKTVEVGAIQPQVFETIPKQHFKEMGRLARITDSEVTVHGPIVGVEMAGFTEQGWQEEQRKRAERQIIDTMEKTHSIDSQGNTPVTFHAGNMPVQRIRYLEKEERERLLKDFPRTSPAVRKEIESGRIRDYMLAVNPDTGELRASKFEERVWPEGKIIFDPKRRIDMMNRTEWDNKKFQLHVLDEQKARLAQMIPTEEYVALKEKMKTGQVTPEEFDRIQQLEAPLHESNVRGYMEINEMYNDYMKYGNSDYQKILRKKAEKIVGTKQEQEARGKRTEQAYEEYARKRDIQSYQKYQKEANYMYSDKVVGQLKNAMQQLPAPEKWKPADDFATEQVAKTAANAAFDSWKRYKDRAPTLALENYPDTVMSTGDEAVKVVKRAREKFVELAKSKGLSGESAKRTAAKLIGVTWDLGHINMLRKHGFPEEYIVEQTKKVAPYVQKMHLTDNFGFDDSHLPPGMGNVPFKKALAEIEKAGVKVPNIVEAGGFAQHFKTSPHPYVLEALGSPLYTYMQEPYWNQARLTYGNYFQGYGDFLPDFHFQTYGSPSFSALPAELGGQMPGEKRQQFAGRGME